MLSGQNCGIGVREVNIRQSFIMVILSILISCAYLVGATTGILEEEQKNLQPCPFNLLCRCSRGGPEVGLIYCEDIPLANIPTGINNTKAFALNLRRNGLRRIEENGFHRTGMNMSVIFATNFRLLYFTLHYV